MPALPPIVVIDDNPDDIFLMKRLLVRAGVENPILSFTLGSDAIRFFDSLSPAKDQLPSVVFCDFNLPAVRGPDVLRWLRRHPAFQSVRFIIVCGAMDDGEERRQAMEIGADAFVTKFPEVDEIRRLLSPPPASS